MVPAGYAGDPKMAGDIRHEFAYKAGRMGKQWGIGEPAGKVWGALLFSSRPVTQKDIAVLCSYSPGLVSRSIVILENLGMAENVGKDGKEKLYAASASAMDFFGKLVSNFMAHDVKPLISMLEENIESIKEKDIRARMECLIEEYTNMGRMLGLFSAMLEAGSFLSPADISRATAGIQNKIKENRINDKKRDKKNIKVCR